MSAFDNLFAARSYESIGSDYKFLEFFSPNILEAIKPPSFQNKVTIFRSGPGGGKTSLLQLFGPGPLRRISGNKDVNKDLYMRLKNLGALTDRGPSVLSVYHRLDAYEAFPEGVWNNTQSLFTLIGARLVMKWLASILSLEGLSHDRMDGIQVGIPKSGKTLPGSPIPCNGLELYEWAAHTEKVICGAMGSLEKQSVKDIPMFRGLDHIHIMVPGHVTVDGRQITTRPLIALDDLHRLNNAQRTTLIEHMCAERYPAPVWLAERLDVLSLQNFFRGIDGREYDVVQLEKYWEDRGTAFESFAKSISERRTQEAGIDFKISPLPDHLDDDIVPKFDSIVKAALHKIQERVRDKSKNTRLYDLWIADIEKDSTLPFRELLLRWKSLEIKISRERKKNPIPLLDIPLPLPVQSDDNPVVREAVELMLSDEFNLPHYYGFKRIATLATFNIELFLELGYEMMDRVVAQILRNQQDYRINARDQEEIVKKVARRHWDDIERTNRNGVHVRLFLESFCKFARGENTPNASYGPGVTGFGITRNAWHEIKDAHTEDIRRLSDVLHTCLAQNYLKHKSVKQGRKGDDPKTILYLNRLLCAAVGLPLGRGGWRKRSTRELVRWLDGDSNGRGRTT